MIAAGWTRASPSPIRTGSGGPIKFTDALGAAMAMGAALTAVGAVVAAVVIRGKPKHELSARGGPELPPPVAL
jgi:hypothetical protein